MSDGIYQGMAPKSELVVGKVLDQQGNGTIQAVEEGIHWILELKNKKKKYPYCKYFSKGQSHN